MCDKKAKQRFKSIKQRNLSVMDEESFKDIYGDDDDNRECYYCKITEKDIHELIKKCHINTKRLGTRGRTMEVDRTKPHLGYTKDNIKLICYWCNNAKTDEFTEDEFKKIGKIMEKIWKERLEMQENTEKNTEKLLTDWDTVNNVFFAFPYGMESSNKLETKWWENIENLAKNIKESQLGININIIYKDSKKIVDEVKKVNEANYNFIANPYLEDVWLRDFMPLALSNNKGVKAVYSPTYYDEKDAIDKKYRKYSHDSHRAGLYIAQGANIECLSLSEGSGYWHEEISTDDEILPIVLDGGNFIHNGKIGFISARLLVENYDIKENCEKSNECCSEWILDLIKNDTIVKIINIIKRQTNLEEIYILPTIEIEIEKKPEMTGHLDGTIRFLNENKLLIDGKYFGIHKTFLEKIFNKNDITPIPISQTLMENDKSTKDNIKGILLNYLRIHNTLFVPCWNEAHTNEELKKHKEELNKFIETCKKESDSDIHCVTVKENGSISSQGGLFNCISWTSYFEDVLTNNTKKGY